LKSAVNAVVAGHICLDIIPGFTPGEDREINELFVPGKLIKMDRIAISLGGAVPNTGIALSKLGINTSLMGKVGGDHFGSLIKDIISVENIDSRIFISNEDTTSYSVIFANPGYDRIIFHHTGANDTFCADDLNYSSFNNTNLFHFGYPSLMKQMYENEGEELLLMLKKIKEVGVTTSVDMSLPDPKSSEGMVNWQKILSKALKYVDIFIPSIEEILYMIDIDVYNDLKNDNVNTDPLDKLNIDILPALGEKLIKMGVGIVVLKCGSKGYYIKTANKARLIAMGRGKPDDIDAWIDREAHCEAYSVSPFCSAAGAGDNSIAGFLAAFLRNMSMEDCIKTACLVGAQNVLVYDTLSGVKSWQETMQQLNSDMKFIALNEKTKYWQYDNNKNIRYRK